MVEDKKLTRAGRLIFGAVRFANKKLGISLTTNKIKPKVVKNIFGSGGAYSWSYDGEKNLGEIGPAKDYYLDYTMLTIRSWQAYLESELAQAILKRYTSWIIGKGLRLQCEPDLIVLRSEGVEVTDEQIQKLTQTAEARWKVFAKSKISSYDGMENLNIIARDAHKNANIAGDVLVIMHLINGQVKIQLVDAIHVDSPNYGGNINRDNGNALYKGVEMDATGKHIAYHLNFSNRTIRVAAMNNGIRVAFMVYGSKYRLDNKRGMPLIAVVLETMKKMERYKEATVGSAEERQKVAIYQKHTSQSTGEGIWQDKMAEAFDPDGEADLPEDVNGIDMANHVAATMNKQLINMPIDSELAMLESKNELYFKEFYETNFDFLCAAMEIPSNVAMGKYTDSFSASRAATKDWDHTVGIKREDFSFQFYQRVYDFWFQVEVLKNKLQAPQFLQATEDSIEMIMAAYTSARFTGTNFPHIDPKKEADAVRIKLGSAGAHLPLITQEEGAEELGGADGNVVTQRFAKELENAEKLKIPIAKPLPEETGNGGGSTD